MLIVKATALALAAAICLWGTFAHAQGKYDGEWHGSGTNTSCTRSAPAKVEVQFIVGADGIHGSYNEYPLTGNIIGHHLRLKAITPNITSNPITNFEGSLENGYLRMYLLLGYSINCAVIKLERIGDVLEDEGEAYEEYEEEDFESGGVEELEDDIGKYLRKPPTEKEVQEMDNFILCRLGEIYEIPFVVTEIKKRYLKCDKLLQMFQEEPEEDTEFEY